MNITVCRHRRQALSSTVHGLGVAVFSGLALGGCSSLDTVTSWMPWGSSKPKLPVLPDLSGENKISLMWRVGVGELGQGFAPCILDRKLMVATRSGRLLAFDLGSGERQLDYQHRRGFSTGVSSAEGLLLVASMDGFLLALNQDGSSRWSTFLGAEAVSIPEAGSGIVVVRTSDNRIQAFDLERGQVRWSVARQSPPLVLRSTNAAHIQGDAVYMGLPGGRMLALRASNGQVLWEAAVSTPRGTTEIERLSDVLGRPIVDGNDVLAASFQGKLSNFDRLSGQVRWSREVNVAGGIAADGQQVVAVDDRGQLQAFSRNGAPQWKQESLRGRRLSAPVLATRMALVADEEGVLHALGREQGQFIGRLNIASAPLACAPMVEQTQGWTLAVDGSVCGFRMNNA